MLSYVTLAGRERVFWQFLVMAKILLSFALAIFMVSGEPFLRRNKEK